MPGELLIYFVVMFIAYCIWIKIKAHFTGRTFSQQTQHDADRKQEEVCRNCEFRADANHCEFRSTPINPDTFVCDYFLNKHS